MGSKVLLAQFSGRLAMACESTDSRPVGKAGRSIAFTCGQRKKIYGLIKVFLILSSVKQFAGSNAVFVILGITSKL